MLDVINRYAHGFVAIPVILACKRKNLFELLEHHGSLTLERMVELLGANGGHLQVALRMMRSLNWLSQNEAGEYTITDEARVYQQIPEDILDWYHLPVESYLMGGEQQAELLKDWIESSRQRWNVDDPMIADFLDGILVIPILLALQKHNLLVEDEQKSLFSELRTLVREELYELFASKGWAHQKEDRFSLTDVGRFIVDRALITGTTASYTPMLSRMPDVLFGDCQAVFRKDANGHESHVDRTLNVVASGFQHKKYFADVDEIILSIFNRLPYEEQPKYVADMGCGDGTLLKRVYETIRFKSARGKVLERYPICMIGVDYNEASLKATAQTLVDIPHIVMKGDIGDPKQMVKDLRLHGIHDPENILHIRSFLDHDRPFIPPQNLEKVQARYQLPYQGVYVDANGQAIPPHVMVQSLVEHLGRWSSVVTKHGLIILEVHCLEPEVVNRFLDRSENLHFDAYQAFSMQHLVEADVFLMAAAEVGLFPKFEFSKRYPKTFSFTRITLNCFEKSPYTIRHPHLSDLPGLVNLEAKCWQEYLRAGAHEIRQRLKRFPNGQLVLEMNGQIVGVVYSQRISSAKVLENTTYVEVPSLHTREGSVIQLLGMNILPEMQDKGLGDHLREFMLQWCALKGGIERVVGVTRCKNYVNHARIPMEEYIRQRNELGQLLDPILRFHEEGGAKIEGIIPNYRPEDTDNLGIGILIEYDLHNYSRERSHLVHQVSPLQPSKGIEKDKTISSIVEESILFVLGRQRQAAFSASSSLIEMGLDSLDSLELRSLLSNHLGVELSSDFFFEYNTPQAITDYFQKQILEQKRNVLEALPEFASSEKDEKKSSNIPIQEKQDQLPYAALTKELQVLGTPAEEVRVQDTETKASLTRSLPYTDYVRWQSEMLASSQGEQHWEYWKQQLASASTLLDLPTDRPRPPVQTYRGASYIVEPDRELIQKLSELAKAERASLYNIMLAAFQVLLYRYTGQEDILVGSPMAGRLGRKEFKEIVGYFSSPVVLRANLAGVPTFKEFLAQVSCKVYKAQEHQDYPFPLLVERLKLERDPSYSPLFQVSFTWQKHRWYEKAQASSPGRGKGLNMKPWLIGLQRGATFDLDVQIEEAGSTLTVNWQYNTDLFDATTITRMVGHFQTLLEGIVANPEQPISQLPLLTAVEQHQLLVEWNDTQIEYPKQKCLHQLFEEQVERTPDAVAVVYESEQLTYRELNCRANQLAHHLRALGVKPEVLVAICVERSLEMLVGLLGILKAGGAFVPLDPAYPQERLAYMLSDSQVLVLLTQKKLRATMPAHQAGVVCLDSDWEVISSQSEDNPVKDVKSQNLAYVIYTSGSTGKPKGVMIPHQGIVNYLSWCAKTYAVAEGSGAPVNSSICFDGTLPSIFPLLFVGKKVVLLPEKNEIEALSICLRSENNFRPVNLTPVHLEWLNQLLSKQEIVQKGVFIVGGEAVQGSSVSLWRTHAPQARIINEYGPTETVIGCCFYEVNNQTPSEGVVPIGRPIANTQIYILDRHLQPVPIGISGELYVGGDGLARGYLNRPELTYERFIPNPFDKSKSERLYKTGDLARYQPDGNIEFLGRIDNQVKIRGFRIELGEIEAALIAHPHLFQATVIVREDCPGDKQIVAYVLPDPKLGALHETSLRDYLKQKLPKYMVPSAFVVLDELPLTPNGKVDRRALPAPDRQRPELQQTYVAPQTEWERLLSSIWSELLKLDNVGIHDNFFELGGNSLLTIRLVAQVEQELKVNLPVVKIFEYPTIAKLARYLSQNQSDVPSSQKVQQPSRVASNKPATEGVAIIGMAGRFPKAGNVEELWRNLCAGVASITFSSDDELAPSIDDELKQAPNYVKAKGILEDADKFDAAFFGINPREAEVMDPQQRVFLEVAQETLENAGYNSETFDGAIGLYAGSSFNTYFANHICGRSDILNRVGELQIELGNDPASLTTRASYKLNLTGPSVNVNTACSTSLVAVIHAFNSLVSYQCDMALAGGICITTPLKSGYLYQEGGRFSPDGYCRPFDAKAQGTLIGNGVGIVVLKRLEDAIRDGDRIEAVIRGVGMNNDGSDKVSFSAPSVEGQAKAIRMAHECANVNPETISYVQAHGTATPLGDPIEIAALTQAFRAQTAAKGFCAMGSVKSNLGHLDTAAGVTGLIKTILALKHKQIPPSLHFSQPNPQIDFANSPFYVNTKLCEWKASSTPLRAGVSSFGIGGTNAHVVLEEAPALEPSGASRPRQLLLLSAKTPSALEAATANLCNYLKAHPESNLADVAYTLQVGRQAFSYRRFVVCDSVADAVQALESLSPQQTATRQIKPRTPEIVFMFPGQGSQYANMGLNYQQEPIFRETVDRCAEILKPHLNRDLREVLYAEAEAETAATSLRQTCFTQPAIFTVEYALAQLWQSWGIRPQAAIGHSIGEFVAATLAGVFSLEDALMLIATRGRLMQQLPEGSMLSVRCPAAKVEKRLSSKLSIAAINGPSLCVVSGPTEAVAAFQSELEQEGVCKHLHTSHAFHSQMIEPIIEPFTQYCRQVRLSPPQIPFVSTVTGTWITPEQATDPQYWARHMRETVRFAEGVKKLWQEPDRLLLEVGPRATLTTLARQQATDIKQQIAIPSLGRTADNQAEWTALLTAVGQLWITGASIDWRHFYQAENRHRIALPTYPFERQRFWIEPAIHPTTAKVEEPLSQHQPTQEMTFNFHGNHQQASQQHHLIPVLKAVLEEISGLEMDGMDEETTFLEMGLDSLTLTQVAQALEKKFFVKIAFRQLLEVFPNFKTLAEFLANELSLDTPSVAVALQATTPSRQPNDSQPELATPAMQAASLETIVAQQLQIMARQLDLLNTSSNSQKAASGAATKSLSPHYLMSGTGVPPVSRAGRMPTPQSEEIDSKHLGAAARIQTPQGVALTSQQKKFLDKFAQRYTTRTAKSKEYAQSHRTDFADPRTVSGFSPTLKELVYPIVAVRSSGSKIWDLDGNEYVDLVNGFGSNFFGYNPPFIKEAIAAQLECGMEIGPQTPLAGEVAKLICELTNFDRATFCNTGSEAVLGAIRLARTVTGRSKIAIFSGAFHGIFDEVIVRGTKKLQTIPAAVGIVSEAVQNVLVLDYDSSESLDILKARAGELAAILVEPVQSRSPELQPKEFLHQLRRITKNSGAALIFDEVITGFRIHPGGAQAYFGVQADIATYGKVVGGGMPIGVIAGKSKFMDALDGGFWRFGDASVPEVGITFFAGTFVRHPLAMAAAKATLEYLQRGGPQLQWHLNEKSDELVAALNNYFQQVKAPMKVVNFGSLMILKFLKEVPYGELLFYLLREKGVHIWENRPCFLTLAHSDADIEFVLQAFVDGVREMQQAGFLNQLSEPLATCPINGSKNFATASNPPLPGAKLGRDSQGNPAWYVPDPDHSAKYLHVGAID